MDLWSWICELPNSDEWTSSFSPLTYQLGATKPTQLNKNMTQSIHLKVERAIVPDLDSTVITFSVCYEEKTLWVSDTCQLSSHNPFLPLVLQLIQEIVSRAPVGHDITCPRSQLQKLKPDPVAWILDTHSPESISTFFNLIFLTRLFWVCVCDAPSEVGSLYFSSLLAPNLDAFSCKDAPVLRSFFISIGTDVELCFMRTFGYMLAKWLILKEVGVGLQVLTPLSSHTLGFSYATESHGLWVLKGYIPVLAMPRTRFNGPKNQYPVIDAKESVLRYALAHQQLEAVIQLEYTVGFCDGFIQVNTRVNNLRFHVVKLGFNKNCDDSYADERHFPSRIRVWVGPEAGASYVAGLTLGRSTENVEREKEIQKVWKGSFGKMKIPRVKATAKMTTRTKTKNWRWDQDAEGNVSIFDGIMCDNTTGVEVSTWKPSSGSGGAEQLESSFRKRYTGANRSFTKSGGLVFAGDECGEGVGWRLKKETEGSVLRWRIGGQVWLSYCPNEINSSYFETRCVEWCDEVDLPLIPSK
ncbi:hypothetical protein LguiB_007040 [Lonicera macranthoides]